MNRPGLNKLSLWAILAALVLAFSAVAAGCGGDDEDEAAPPPVAEELEEPTDAEEPTEEPTGEPIRIGILSNCEGPFGAWWEHTVGGAQLPLLERGAQKAGENPTDGIENAVIAGRPIEIVGYGCSDDTPDVAIQEARRLVEQENAEILIGPLSGDEGIAVANYAEEHPDRTFLNGISGAQDTTLKVQAPNFFRFQADGAQWTAGLGDYAYNDLGWRNAVVIGDDYSFPYTSNAGFVAEFCSIGGQISERIWPPLGTTDYSSFIAQLPQGVDGYFISIGGAGLISFLRQYEEQVGPIDGEQFMGNVFWTDPLVHQEFGERLIGVATAGMTAGDSTENSVQQYYAAAQEHYPEQADAAASVFFYGYYLAMRGLIEALDQIDGDLGESHENLHEALADAEFDAPWGRVRLDDNRQAVMDNWVQRIVEDHTGDGVPDVQTFRRIPEVSQDYGGHFSPDTPNPDRTNPECVEENVPPWVGEAEDVGWNGNGDDDG